MRRFKLDKLVTDEVFASMLELGQMPEHRVLSDDEEFEAELRRKLLEEAREVAEAEGDAIDGELANLLAVARQIAILNGLDFSVLAGVEANEATQTGAFDGRNYVGTLALQYNDTWVDYYSARPERFPEL